MRALLRRPSLLTKFSVLSLLVIVALGIGVGRMLQDRIERRALLESTKLAETMTTLGMQPILLPGDLAAGQGRSTSTRSTSSSSCATSTSSGSSV